MLHDNFVKYHLLLISLWLISSAHSCDEDHELLKDSGKAASFSNAYTAGKAVSDNLDEVSGIAGSLTNPDVIWAHNDSGDEARIFAMTATGGHLATYYFEHARAVDWEDMASGPGPVAGRNYLYIGDTGDNEAKRSSVIIYRLEEPLIQRNTEAYTDTIPAGAVDAFRLKYPGGPRDAEALMVDPVSGNMYIITKREREAGVYKVKLPEKPGDTLILQLAGTIPHTGITGGDISAEGDEVLLKNYNRLFYWKRKEYESLEDALERKSRKLPYTPEPQGEAIAWKKDGSGFFTLSEEALGIEAVLYWYRRRK